mgnify:CR=1 FL=1
MNKLNLFNLHTLIRIFFFFIFLNYLYFSIRLTIRENSWIAGDWLMNYEAGILRRGFSGEIILLISKISSISVTYLLIFIQTSLFLTFLYFLFNILYKKKINLWFLFLLFSPVTIAFTFYDPLTVGRKEVIFFAFYTIYVSFLLKNLKWSIIRNLAYFLIGCIFVLIHEIFIFFSTFFIFSKIFYLYKKNIKINIINLSNELFLIIGSLIAAIILVFFSSNDPNLKELVCNRLIDNGLSPEICTGALTEIFFSNYLNSYKSFGLFEYIISYGYIKTYTIAILLFFTPLILFLFFQKLDKKDIKIFIIFLIFQLIFVASIFIVVNDWGRYLNIYFILILVFVSYFFLEEKVREIKKFNFKRLIIVFFLILYASSWHMPHCCQKNLGKGLESFKDRIFFRINNPTKYNDLSRKIILKLLRVNEHK